MKKTNLTKTQIKAKLKRQERALMNKHNVLFRIKVGCKNSIFASRPLREAVMTALFICVFSLTGWSQASKIEFFRKNYAHTNQKVAIAQLDSIKKVQRLNKTDLLRWHINYANHLYNAQKYAASVEKVIAGLNLNEEVKNDNFAVFFHKTQGNCYYNLGYKDKALLHYFKGYEVAKKIANYCEIAYLSNNIGAMYTEQHHLKKAEFYLRQSIASMKTCGKESASFMTYRILASLYDENNMFNQAAAIYRDLIALSKTIEDSSLISTAYSYYANHFILRKHYDSAQLQIDKSFDYLRNAKKGSASLEVAYNIKEELAFLKKDYKTAYQSLQKGNKIREQINKAEQQKAISALEIKYETEKKEQALKLKNSELDQVKQRSSFQLVVSLLSIIVLLILAVLIYLRIRWKQKIKLEVERVKKEQEILFTKEQERTRIARELHDNIGSTISYITKKTEAILHENPSQQILMDDLTQVNESARDIMDGLRETLWALHAKEITNIDLVDKLKVYCKKHALVTCKITDEVEVEHIIQNESALALFRCAQEIINNCNKHSGAEQMMVRFKSTENCVLQMDFTDDGIGFDLEEKAEHYGLKNIKSRLEEINAKIEIQSEINRGTSYSITLRETIS